MCTVWGSPLSSLLLLWPPAAHSPRNHQSGLSSVNRLTASALAHIVYPYYKTVLKEIHTLCCGLCETLDGPTLSFVSECISSPPCPLHSWHSSHPGLLALRLTHWVLCLLKNSPPALPPYVPSLTAFPHANLRCDHFREASLYTLK